MPKHLLCCNKEVKKIELWILKDFKGFTQRKLLIGKCSICGDDVALQIMTSTKTGEKYYNLYNGIEAVKTIYREKRRKLVVIPDIKAEGLYGWLYGVNVQIRNKKGQVTQIRQYSCNYSTGKKSLEKVINNCE